MRDMENILKGIKIIVIGAGPGGLTFSRAAQANGATVEIIEQAGDPRGDEAGYTDRSFNLTLNNVGRTALGDERAWVGSTDIVGRAIHNIGGDVKYASYGEGDSAILTSVPRPILRQNMVKLAQNEGVSFRFRTEVISLDPDQGQVVMETKGGKISLAADLIVVADGIHSLADSFITGPLRGSINVRTEKLNYVTVMLSKEACHDMSLHHIHFWHEPKSSAVAIGLPNKDGTIAALLISRFDDVATSKSPFAERQQAIFRLQSDFPQLLQLEADLVDRVLGRKRGNFYYKAISDYVLGRKCVVVGDAGSASPPWAGFGANTAIYSADALLRFIVGLGGNLDQALPSYGQHKRILTELVLDYAEEHGEFLNKEVTKNPEQRPIGPVLGQLVSKAIKRSDIPQGVKLLSFDQID